MKLTADCTSTFLLTRNLAVLQYTHAMLGIRLNMHAMPKSTCVLSGKAAVPQSSSNRRLCSLLNAQRHVFTHMYMMTGMINRQACQMHGALHAALCSDKLPT